MITQKIWVLLLILYWGALTPNTWAQIKNTGKPFITNYASSDYHAHDQNWCMVQDRRGVLYVGNSTSLLEFDGVQWNNIEVPNKSTIRSLVLGHDGVVYVGGQNFLGYVATNAQGRNYLVSFRDQIPKEAAEFRDVWEMYQTANEGIVCRTRDALFIIKNKKVSVIAPQKERFSFGAMAGGKFFVKQPDLGNFVLENGQLKPLPVLGQERYRNSFPFGKGKTLLLAQRAINVYDGKSVKQFSASLDNYFKKFRIYCSAKINENYFAIGTSNGGILIIDKNGSIVQHLHKGNGLLDNIIYCLYVDQNQNLWAGLSKGIAQIQVNSPFTVFDASMGLDGATYNTLVSQNRLIVATSSGIYYKN